MAAPLAPSMLPRHAVGGEPSAVGRARFATMADVGSDHPAPAAPLPVAARGPSVEAESTKPAAPTRKLRPVKPAGNTSIMDELRKSASGPSGTSLGGGVAGDMPSDLNAALQAALAAAANAAGARPAERAPSEPPVLPPAARTGADGLYRERVAAMARDAQSRLASVQQRLRALQAEQQALVHESQQLAGALSAFRSLLVAPPVAGGTASGMWMGGASSHGPMPSESSTGISSVSE